ncbi:hypothetical protein, partial [Bacillus thuringiensis]|uniref:hypothetical protein n=2 Tax=Bacillus TaxID=1386 RepID=UPI0021E7067C
VIVLTISAIFAYTYESEKKIEYNLIWKNALKNMYFLRLRLLIFIMKIAKYLCMANLYMQEYNNEN